MDNSFRGADLPPKLKTASDTEHQNENSIQILDRRAIRKNLFSYVNKVSCQRSWITNAIRVKVFVNFNHIATIKNNIENTN